MKVKTHEGQNSRWLKLMKDSTHEGQNSGRTKLMKDSIHQRTKLIKE